MCVSFYWRFMAWYRAIIIKIHILHVIAEGFIFLVDSLLNQGVVMKGNQEVDCLVWNTTVKYNQGVVNWKNPLVVTWAWWPSVFYFPLKYPFPFNYLPVVPLLNSFCILFLSRKHKTTEKSNYPRNCTQFVTVWIIRLSCSPDYAVSTCGLE